MAPAIRRAPPQSYTPSFKTMPSISPHSHSYQPSPISTLPHINPPPYRHHFLSPKWKDNYGSSTIIYYEKCNKSKIKNNYGRNAENHSKTVNKKWLACTETRDISLPCWVKNIVRNMSYLLGLTKSEIWEASDSSMLLETGINPSWSSTVRNSNDYQKSKATKKTK